MSGSNWVRIVTAIPGPEGTYKDWARAEVARLVPSMSASPLEATGIELKFQLPTAGWLSFSLSSGAQSVVADFTDVLDPFSDRPGHGEVEISLVRWLQRIAAGEHPLLAVECEGPWVIAILAPIDETHIRVSASAGERITFDITIDRLVFVRDFYRQLMSFWESDGLKKNWSEWQENRAQWSIRSELIERAIG